jgi:DNA-binding HxlR family transcriptional regulator
MALLQRTATIQTYPSYPFAMNDCPYCPVDTTLKVIGGKWKLPLLWFLRDGKKRYSELQKLLGKITPKMLAQQLRELERDGIVERKVYPVIPPRVEYSLTPYGKTLQPILASMGAWGDKHIKRRGAKTA